MDNINDLIRERDKFLEENPDLKPMQEEISMMLSNVLDPMQRMDILFMLISGKLKDLQDNWEKLTDVCENAKEEITNKSS